MNTKLKESVTFEILGPQSKDDPTEFEQLATFVQIR